jgi:ABC-type transport system involved in multi-copper enzyme maturation permease subunit
MGSQISKLDRPSVDVRLLTFLEQRKRDLDRRLPEWARRSNPIVRRHLGIYWKTLLPEARPLLTMYLVQVILVALSYPFPILFDLAMPMITASIILLPLAILIYGRLLIAIGVSSAEMIVDEQKKNTLTLLRATPIPLKDILLSKMAASIWRQVEDLGLLLMAALAFSLPLLILQYASLWPLDQYPVVARAAMALGLAASLVRLLVEPLMVGALGIMAGAALPYRNWARASVTVLTLFYFLLINLPRRLPMAWEMRAVVEIVLPLILPVLIAWVAFRLAHHALLRD